MSKIKQGFMTPNMARKRSGQPSKSGMNQVQSQEPVRKNNPNNPYVKKAS